MKTDLISLISALALILTAALQNACTSDNAKYAWTDVLAWKTVAGDASFKNSQSDVFYVAAKPQSSASTAELTASGLLAGTMKEQLSKLAKVKSASGAVTLGDALKAAKAQGCGYLVHTEMLSYSRKKAVSMSMSGDLAHFRIFLYNVATGKLVYEKMFKLEGSNRGLFTYSIDTILENTLDDFAESMFK